MVLHRPVELAPFHRTWPRSKRDNLSGATSHQIERFTGNRVLARLAVRFSVIVFLPNHVSPKFYRFAQEFELLAINLDRSDEPERRKVLLRRLRVVIDEIDELMHQQEDSKELRVILRLDGT
jgi:hypothetical protein